MTDDPAAPEHRTPRARLQDLAVRIVTAEDVEDVEDTLAELVATAREDLGAGSAALVLPADAQTWTYELVDGPLAGDLLGMTVDPGSPEGRALAADATELDAVTAITTDCATSADSAATTDGTTAGTTGQRRIPAALAMVNGGSHGIGALVLLEPATNVPVPAAHRERLDALAALAGLALGAMHGATADPMEDERGRIARDLHDLAIQELFAVGMELESLTGELRNPDGVPSNARIRSSVETSVRGLENAVAQIRQVVQSLRRERPRATLSERLRHEVGLSASGLGFMPALRLPSPPADIDAEVDPDIAEDIVAVVRECLANAARHARATAVAVSITLFSEGVDRVLQVSVSDNGRGIDPSVSRRSGLANMASRARRHQGWVDALNLEPGTMISWRITLPPA